MRRGAGRSESSRSSGRIQRARCGPEAHPRHAHAAAVLDWRVAERLRRAWSAHGARVATDASYAAVTAVVLARFLCLVPVGDVIAAVLAALLGVYMTGVNKYRPDVSRWTNDWDLS